MMKQLAAAALMAAMVVGVASAQAKKGSGTKSVMHDITIKADDVYTGTMEIAIDEGKVTGSLHLTLPTEITGKVAGTAKAGVLELDFPYLMVQRQCEGNVTMSVKLPEKPGPASGTMEAVGCGIEEGTKLAGTLELTPRK